MNIMNGSLKGRVYESPEQKAELASAVNDERQRLYKIGFVEDERAYIQYTKESSDKER